MSAYRSARTHVGWGIKLSLTVILVVVLRQHSIHAVGVFPPRVHPESCSYGSFNINVNPHFCPPRALCRKGVSEFCRNYGGTSDCNPGLYCK